MRRFIRYLPIIITNLCVAMSLPAHAQLDETYFVPDIETAPSLTEEGLLSAFSGQTHLGTYSFLRDNIDTVAFTETTFEDGRIRHVQKSSQKEHVDTGQWELEDDNICYDYDNPGLTQACFKIFVVGNCYYHYQTSVQGFPAFGFTARSVIKGERPNCDPAIA